MVVKTYKHDGVNWEKKKQSDRTQEVYQTIKIDGIEKLTGFYSKSADDPLFRKRTYRLSEAGSPIFLVHYRDYRVGSGSRISSRKTSSSVATVTSSEKPNLPNNSLPGISPSSSEKNDMDDVLKCVNEAHIISSNRQNACYNADQYYRNIDGELATTKHDQIGKGDEFSIVQQESTSTSTRCTGDVAYGLKQEGVINTGTGATKHTSSPPRRCSGETEQLSLAYGANGEELLNSQQASTSHSVVHRFTEASDPDAHTEQLSFKPDSCFQQLFSEHDEGFDMITDDDVSIN
jgi:hypothetical protein